MISGVPQRLVADLAIALGISVAVETGTFRGGSTRKLAAVVDRVISIELSEELHEQALHSGLADVPGVTLLQGSSIDILPGVVRDLAGPAIYWLDGHWTEGAGTAGFQKQCPVLDEIAAIDGGADSKRSCILIDDARFHLGAPPPPYRRSDWPTFPVVVDQLRANHNRCFTVLDDVIIAGPPQIQEVLDTYWLGQQWSGVLAEHNRLRAELLFPTLSGAARVAARALLRRKPS
jgi:hypothetical protein